MLDRCKLLVALEKQRHDLFITHSQEYELARTLWQRIVADPLFPYKARSATTSFSIPTWDGKLDAAHAIPDYKEPYTLISVDGSQIYPDRHHGISCFLINIGSVVIHYGTHAKPVTLNSTPYFFTAEQMSGDFPLSPDWVNCMRDSFEWQQGFEIAAAMHGQSEAPVLVAFDGALIPWHLEGKDPAFKAHFTEAHCALLEKFYAARIPHVSYASFAKNKEVSHLIRLLLCDFNTNNCGALATLDHIADAGVAQFFLSPGTHSTLFAHTSKIMEAYPSYLQPYFVYVHCGKEIARIEMPAWIAQDEALSARVIALVYDQVAKRHGYPVTLAEAHEQAVIKGPDRDFFYHLLAKYAVEKKQRMIISQKSLKKRGIGV